MNIKKIGNDLMLISIMLIFMSFHILYSSDAILSARIACASFMDILAVIGIYISLRNKHNSKETGGLDT
tara:strand:+ start:385 stop:591 length:207 start_codon:yes stop_codon:yes gene_type:complete